MAEFLLLGVNYRHYFLRIRNKGNRWQKPFKTSQRNRLWRWYLEEHSQLNLWWWNKECYAKSYSTLNCSTGTIICFFYQYWTDRSTAEHALPDSQLCLIEENRRKNYQAVWSVSDYMFVILTHWQVDGLLCWCCYWVQRHPLASFAWLTSCSTLRVNWCVVGYIVEW